MPVSLAYWADTCMVAMVLLCQQQSAHKDGCVQVQVMLNVGSDGVVVSSILLTSIPVPKCTSCSQLVEGTDSA